ncbi:MarR family protein [Leptospira broomii serovar Hurstbridge str. 5399]|uniref:MarR family protein n=1 Tax=Leptospira broomii serovar Hurstbridge str. 5399 TaxID=1049789 RepID=T0FCF0_9LEPT|nr:MarR family transcriptional regulator [Leptospira broomii]EQA45277.1 MarR family protein [Leptospira broomii serovar Hurstbridge str. 5399]
MSGKTDHVDTIRAQWNRERPDLDVDAIALIGRVHRLSQIIFTDVHKPIFDKHGLTYQDFDVLAALLRSGKPYRKSPGELLSTLMITSGTMTNRIDRLESSGLVVRDLDPDDRRGVLIRLTHQGKEAISRAIQEHVKSETDLLTVLTEKEKGELSRLLKKLLLKLEQRENISS